MGLLKRLGLRDHGSPTDSSKDIEKDDRVVALCWIPWRQAVELSELLKLEKIKASAPDESNYDSAGDMSPVYVLARDFGQASQVLADYQAEVSKHRKR